MTTTDTSSAPREKAKDSYLGRVIAGRYRLEARLGEGGMGVVYRARHVLIERIVALKLIRPDLKEETHLRAWMLREARAANRVDHAHIVDIHDVGETEEGELYLVMEYLLGRSLASEIAKGPMPIARAVDILEQMIAALSRAHDLGVIHRDLKSDNIMLTARGGRQDYVKILDFGLAALTRDPRLAPKGAVFGTPEYMSPEQARGEDAASTSDLYALGILFYEMCTGRLPFRSGDRETLLEMQRSAPPPTPRSLRPDLPEKAEEILLKLLAKDPKDRYRDGHHLREELKLLQRSLPSTGWELKPGENTAPSAPPPPPPAPSPGVVEWSRQAANFIRAVARAYPNGRAPESVHEAATQIWELAAKASRLEGELASHSRKLDAIETRGRALRAEIGRKVEELAGEESRALREAAAHEERLHALSVQRREAMTLHTQIDAHIRNQERPVNHEIYERLGAARARAETLREVQDEYQRRADERRRYATGLKQQIRDLRTQLSRYSEALEGDLQAGRERIERRVAEALEYEKDFYEAVKLLSDHLRGRPECREVLDEELLNERSDRPRNYRKPML